mmetsp:Transcript_54883/g.88949  ORF Transcript_54883/g.88949 Transcript_54883/m.88949 type:complete len:100 (-) Transcript_54883:1163-1462(-)
MCVVVVKARSRLAAGLPRSTTTHTAGCFGGSNVTVSRVLFISRDKLKNPPKNTFFPKHRVESEGKRESLNSPGGGEFVDFPGFSAGRSNSKSARKSSAG